MQYALASTGQFRAFNYDVTSSRIAHCAVGPEEVAVWQRVHPERHAACQASHPRLYGNGSRSHRRLLRSRRLEETLTETAHDYGEMRSPRPLLTKPQQETLRAQYWAWKESMKRSGGGGREAADEVRWAQVLKASSGDGAVRSALPSHSAGGGRDGGRDGDLGCSHDFVVPGDRVAIRSGPGPSGKGLFTLPASEALRLTTALSLGDAAWRACAAASEGKGGS